MRITSVQDADNGLWTCTVTGKGVSGNFETGNGKIQVIVAIPPTTVHLEQDGQLVNGKINLNLDSGRFWGGQIAHFSISKFDCA